MTRTVKRLAPAVLALGVAAGSLGLTAGTAFASTHSAAKTAHATTATAKLGGTCTKSELNKTSKVGKTTLVCKKSGKSYKWAKK